MEAYWIGSSLSDGVPADAMRRSLEERFRPRVDAHEWRHLAAKPADGARPTHAFHVIDVFPRVGLMRGGAVDDTLGLMDACRIRWGRVIETAGEQLVVRSVPLVLDGGRLRLGGPRVETVRRWMDGAGFLDAAGPGDVVSLHWDWACERLAPERLAALASRTERQLAIANRTI